MCLSSYPALFQVIPAKAGNQITTLSFVGLNPCGSDNQIYINTNDTDDDAASGANWRPSWWKIDMTQASRPIAKAGVGSISGTDVYVRKL